MTDATPRLALPLLQPGQSQKEMFHNEALALLDLAVQAEVEALALNTPPPAPAIGQCWVVGTAPIGDWRDAANHLAGWTAGGWRLIAPRPGMSVWSKASNLIARYHDTGWTIGDVAATRVVIGGNQVVGAQGAAITSPAGGAVVDAEARAAITAILGRLRTHGLIAPV